MQVIISMLNLQSEYTKDEKYLKIFKDSQNRIESMALIHEKLYRSGNLAKVDFKDYIRSLTDELFRFHGRVNDISFKIEAEDIFFDIDTAIPCGLIINELVSNSLKHAFPNGREGEIKIALRSTDRDEIELTISDNGIGIPESLDFRNTDTLGLHLVTILVEHELQGKIELNRDKGTEFKIKFKEI